VTRETAGSGLFRPRHFPERKAAGGPHPDPAEARVQPPEPDLRRDRGGALVHDRGDHLFEVTIRWLGGASQLWVIEVSEYALLFITFLGAPYLLAKNLHVVMDLVYDSLAGLAPDFAAHQCDHRVRSLRGADRCRHQRRDRTVRAGRPASDGDAAAKLVDHRGPADRHGPDGRPVPRSDHPHPSWGGV
jgi:hypothetical protein